MQETCGKHVQQWVCEHWKLLWYFESYAPCQISVYNILWNLFQKPYEAGKSK